MFTDTDGNGQPEALQEDHYYPFGLKMADGAMQPSQPTVHLYNGKELQDELGLGWYDYGARMLNPTIGRWNGVDALAETQASFTSYHYTYNNPINFTDPTGLLPKYNWDTGEYEDGEGNVVSWSEAYNQLEQEGGIEEKYSLNGTNGEDNSGMAILVAYPEDNPKIPSNQSVGKWWDEIFGNGNGRADGAGHAGIVLINGETGLTRYFDFGRYNRPDLKSKRGQNEGAVRSSSNFSGLRVPNWNFELSDDENVTRILTRLHQSPLLRNYGPITGSLAKGLNFENMLAYAISMEKRGYLAFGGYGVSSAEGKATYCAKFARGVAGAGGANFGPLVFTGEGNVDHISYWHNTTRITIPKPKQ